MPPQNPPSDSARFSRREFIRRSTIAGTSLGLSTMLPFSRLTAAESSKYTGDLVLLSQLGAAPDKALPKLLDKFKAENPGVNTKLTLFPEEKFVAMYTAAQAAGEQIDVVLLNGQDLRRYAVAGALTSFDDLSYRDRFLPETLKPYTVRGHLWGLPTGAAGGFPIYVNMALLKKVGAELPKNYADLKAVSALLNKQGISAFTHPGKIIYMWPVWFFTTYAQSSGNKSEERTAEILSGKGKFTDPDVVEGLDLLFQFGRDKMFSPSLFSLDFPNALTEFTTGKAAFYLFHDSVAKQIMDSQPPNMELEMMLMPKLVEQNVKSQFPGGMGGVITLPSKVESSRRAVALKLIDSLTQDDSDALNVQLNGGAIPVNANAKPLDVPVYAKEKNLLGQMTIYLDWNWPPEITRAFQEGIQLGLAGRATAPAVAKNIQSILERLVQGGYTFTS